VSCHGVTRNQKSDTAMTSTTPSSDRQPDTKRELLGQSGQYAVAEIIELDGLQPQFDVYDLVIRGHTDSPHRR
jgi:hypothetical protein